MITTTKTRFSVLMTSPQGSVYAKDMFTQHWTTGRVRDMSMSEVKEVLEVERLKRTCSTYQVVDLDIHDALVEICRVTRKAILDAYNYDAMTFDDRMNSEKGRSIRAEAMVAIKAAKAKALDESGLANYMAELAALSEFSK